jgi:cytochrome c1
MILLDAGPPIEIVAVLGIGVIIFFLLVFAAIAFVAYKLLKRKK